MSNKEEQKVNEQEPKSEPKKDQEVVDAKNEQKPIDKDKLLVEEIKSLKEQNESLTKKINIYESQIKSINEDYVKKLNEKAKQANELIEKTRSELNTKLQEEYSKKSKFALEKIAIEVINVVNQFELALSHTPSDPKILNYQRGFNMFLTMLKTILSDINVTEIPVKLNEEFNPNIMECFETKHFDDIKENCVGQLVKKGYKLHDRVIVPALVIVCKKAN